MSTIELFDEERNPQQNAPGPSRNPPPTKKKKTKKGKNNTDAPTSSENTMEGSNDISDSRDPDSSKRVPDEPAEESVYDEDRELYHTPNPQNFNPKLYTFRFPLKVQPRQTYTVLAPPFWILVDHLLAVVWHLYSGENNEKVGIVHLQWALEFSRWIKDENGAMPTAVRSLILVIEDALMEKYSNLSKIRPTKTGYDLLGSSTSTEDKLYTSVTLNDILSRTPGISSEKAYNKLGKKAVMSKASGPARDHSPEKPTGEPAQITPSSDYAQLVKFLNYLQKFQAEKVKNEAMFLAELENAIKDLNNNEDIAKLLARLEDKFSNK